MFWRTFCGELLKEFFLERTFNQNCEKNFIEKRFIDKNHSDQMFWRTFCAELLKEIFWKEFLTKIVRKTL
jgi:hypothetical protein